MEFSPKSHLHCNGINLFHYPASVILGCTDLSKHRVHPSSLPGSLCGCLPARALHCGCCPALWSAGNVMIRRDYAFWMHYDYWNQQKCYDSHEDFKTSSYCFSFFPLGPYRSHLSNSELWIWPELLDQRGRPCWSFPTEHALRADKEPADCHVCIFGQSHPGHQACLHPGEFTVLLSSHINTQTPNPPDQWPRLAFYVLAHNTNTHVSIFVCY